MWPHVDSIIWRLEDDVECYAAQKNVQGRTLQLVVIDDGLPSSKNCIAMQALDIQGAYQVTCGRLT